MHCQRETARSDEICVALGYKTDDIPKSIRSIFKVRPASKSTKVAQFNLEFDVLVPRRSGKINRPLHISLLMLRTESDSYAGITVLEQHNHAQTIPYSHCNAGMVFALNPGDTFKEFLSNAETSPTSAITASTGVSFPTATRVSAVSFPTATGVSGASSPTGVSGASMNNSIPLTIRIPPNPQTSSGAARKRAFLDQFY